MTTAGDSQAPAAVLAGRIFQGILHVTKGHGCAHNSALTDVQVATATDVPSTSLPFYESGKIKILAVCDSVRSKAMPNIPTAVEQGFPQMLANTFNFFVAPAGTPRDVVDTLNKAAMRVMNQEDFLKQLHSGI